MRLQKWNYESQRYDPYDIPDDWHVIVIGSLHQKCNCASCGKEIRFADGHSSRVIRDEHGFGYTVCHQCAQKEEINTID